MTTSCGPDLESLELSHLKALEITTPIPPCFKYTIKYDGRYKCRTIVEYPPHYSGEMSTVDRGANGGVTDTDMRLVSHDYPTRPVDIKGIDNHVIPRLKLGTHGAVANTLTEKVILVFHQYAYYAQERSIHSPLQLEDYNITVDDHPTSLGGSQSLTTPDGLVIPLNFANGLAHLHLRPYTDHEFNVLPHVIMTRNTPWSPHIENFHSQLPKT